ncbi:MAG: hypothetical protein M3367_14045 [Acidobacteriota bacterium]|nr:hypothetical protein [Acidobacteriota bacterium]
MNIKTSIAIGLTIILISVVSIFLIPGLKAQDSRNFVQTEIPVVIQPLKIGDDIVPLEIQCEKVFITKPDTLDTFSCTLINGTHKNIHASIVRYSIIVDSNGKEKQIDRLTTAVPYIHPDLSEVKKPIKPGGSLSVTPLGPIVEPDSVVKRLELEPIYIEFDDETTVGMGGKNVELITNVREGAARYKNSLRQKYLDKGKSVQEILPLLEDNAPFDSEIENFSQRAGAKAYRKFLREKYEKDGIQTINKVLDK